MESGVAFGRSGVGTRYMVRDVGYSFSVEGVLKPPVY